MLNRPSALSMVSVLWLPNSAIGALDNTRRSAGRVRCRPLRREGRFRGVLQG